ncbi:hypothetical protein [Flavivirga rizhaonensis]|uniref:STAS/SEC14 domain-containing protein n=1 Tax=Flavivirga rizhaonensis TaxID=2559571 RepID=A0A4S1DTF2_9FLAO|nr:hypothetical protein [Flavivirga rizhaonensis]TGV01219.1 hypothetical protein EM932_16400 [Flavivirga rizhaonensis]
MRNYKLSFGTIFIIRNNLAEIIANEGVLMDEMKVVELHDFLLDKLEAPFSLLVNKKHSYSYTFQAQRKIAHLKGIKALAIVIGTSGALMSIKTLLSINGNTNKNVKLFQDREEALMWVNKN